MQNYLERHGVAEESYPTVKWDDYQDLLEYRTGRDGAGDFQGFVVEDNKPPYFESVYFIHDEFPELGSMANFALALRAKNDKEIGSPDSEPTTFNYFALTNSFNRPLRDLPDQKPRQPSEATIQQSLVRSKLAGLSLQDARYMGMKAQLLAGFSVRTDILAARRMEIRENLCQLTNNLMKHILDQKPRDANQVVKLTEGFIRSQSQSFKYLGIKEINFNSNTFSL